MIKTFSVNSPLIHLIYNKLFKTSRSSRPEVFCKKGVLKNLEKFLRKPPVAASKHFGTSFVMTIL